MGNTWLHPDDVVPFVDAAQEDVAEVNGPDAVVDLLETDGVLSALAMNSSRFLRRMVPALVTRLTMKCPGYSTGGRVPVYSRGEGW